MENKKEKPVVVLSESNGNSIAIVAKCTRALRRAGYTKEQLIEFTDEALSGDYDNVIQTAMKWCDVE